MPVGPRGEKRPADLIGCAVAVARIATGETENDRITPSGRVKSGHAGAKARLENTTAERRKDIATNAANERWR